MNKHAEYAGYSHAHTFSDSYSQVSASALEYRGIPIVIVNV